MADAIKVTPELLAAIEKSVHHQVAWGAIRPAGENGRVALALVARIRELEATLAAATAPTSDTEWAAVLVWAYREVEAGRSAALEWARPQIDAMLAARREEKRP